MNATTTRGRRILAVLATTSTMLLPAVGASAAPAEQANDRATAAQERDGGQEQAQEKNERATEAQEQRSERQDADDTDGTSEEWTEDNDTNDGDTPNNVADDGDNAHPSGQDRSVEHGQSGNQGNAQSDPDDDGRGPDRSNGGVDQPNGEGGVDKADQDGNNGCGNDDDFEDDNEGWCGRPPVEDTEDDLDVDDGTEREDKKQQKDCPAGQSMVDGECTTTEVDSEEETRTVTEDDCPAGATMGDDGECETATTTVNPVSTTTPGFEVAEPTLEGVMGERIEREEDAVLGVTLTNEVESATTEGILAAALPAPGDAELGAADAGALPRTGAGLAGLAAFGLSALVGGTALSRRRS
ncbi:MAG: hypothetical protein KY457_13620 [Actinobacteria bacterium]|nr:hypothetical protein [Actinomycetota bacterium]